MWLKRSYKWGRLNHLPRYLGPHGWLTLGDPQWSFRSPTLTSPHHTPHTPKCLLQRCRGYQLFQIIFWRNRNFSTHCPYILKLQFIFNKLPILAMSLGFYTQSPGLPFSQKVGSHVTKKHYVTKKHKTMAQNSSEKQGDTRFLQNLYQMVVPTFHQHFSWVLFPVIPLQIVYLL